MKKKAAVLLFAAVLCLTACTGQGNMYNLETGEKTTFDYGFNGGGRGKIKGTFAAGEMAVGEYSVVSSGSIGWGSVYASVYTPNSSASGNATALSIRQNGTRYGSAILTGSRGTIITCEFALGLTGHGFGACKSNSGTLYKLFF